jgi:hypothetical protein
MSGQLFASAGLLREKQPAVAVISMLYDNSVCNKDKSIGVVKENKWCVLWGL